MPETNELPDPAKLLKKVLAEANFQNTDIGGAVFSMLDSLSYDMVSTGFEFSDATEDLMQEVINLLAKDYDKIRTDDIDDEEEIDDGSDIVAAIAEMETEEEEEEIVELPDEEDDEEPIDLTVLDEVNTDGQGNQESAVKG